MRFYAPEAGYPGGCDALRDIGPVSDVQIVSAFDIDARKVGLDLADAIDTEPNNGPRFVDVPATGVTVCPGPLAGSLTSSARDLVPQVLEASVADVATVLRDTDTQLVLSLLPAGSTRATHAYARAALLAGCGFANGAATVLARSPQWKARFGKARLALLGDDLNGQLGATVVHQALARLLSVQGVSLDQTYQINAAGNMNFVNLSDPRKSAGKAVTKAAAVLSQANHGRGMDASRCYTGTADYVPFLGDRKVAFLRLEGHTFGELPFDIELRMNVPDSGNGAAAALDVVRAAALLSQQHDIELADAVNALLMKEPSVKVPQDIATARVRSAVADFAGRR
jgi:myo-inositol-1-phosphate synthase